jgi:hypothetical protein
MSRNEIRLRRHRITETNTGADRYRNYSRVLRRHERYILFRKIWGVALLTVLLLIVIIMIYYLSTVKKTDGPSKNTTDKTALIHFSRYAPGLSSKL